VIDQIINKVFGLLVGLGLGAAQLSSPSAWPKERANLFDSRGCAQQRQQAIWWLHAAAPETAAFLERFFGIFFDLSIMASNSIPVSLFLPLSLSSAFAQQLEMGTG
jgi:hypothetical protein